MSENETERRHRAAILMMRRVVKTGERYATAERLVAERADLAALEAEYRRRYGREVA